MAEPVIELTVKGNDKVVVHGCGKCRRVAYSEDAARQCCEPHICQCGATCERYRAACNDCIAKKRAERERDRFEKAEKVSWRDYDGPFCVDPYGDTYLWDGSELHEYLYDLEPEERPRYVWACTRQTLTLNASDIIDAELERQEHHEDAMSKVHSLDELQVKLDEWLAGQDVESWWPDDSKAVLLDGFKVDAA